MRDRLALCCLAAILSSASIAQSTRDSSAITSLVNAERSFARTSLEKGARPSFMMFFADDAVVFRPHPVKYKEAMKSVPAPKNPLETTLSWEPLYADVSLSGDMGYTTGPSVWIDNTPAKRPTYYGFYFSIWKKQSTGEWKVAFDIGVELPGPYNGPRALQLAPPTERRTVEKKMNAEEQRSSLLNAERIFLRAVNKSGASTALDQILGIEPRVHRQKEQPIIGSDSIRAYFISKLYLSTWEPLYCDVAESGDLGYVYGSYEIKGPDDRSAEKEKGYYIRVWKQDAVNQWKFVVEVTNPLPLEAPKAKQ